MVLNVHTLVEKHVQHIAVMLALVDVVVHVVADAVQDALVLILARRRNNLIKREFKGLAEVQNAINNIHQYLTEENIDKKNRRIYLGTVGDIDMYCVVKEEDGKLFGYVMSVDDISVGLMNPTTEISEADKKLIYDLVN